MEKKKLQSISIAALFVSILPLAALVPSFLHLSLSDGIRTVWAGANIVFVLLGRHPNCLGRSQYRLCPAGPDSFGSLCAEQGKPQCYQYRINSSQCFLVVADGRNCRTRFVPFFRSVRKWLCVKSEKFLGAV